MWAPKNTQGKGESMAEKGNDNAPEATKKKAKEGSAGEATKSPESGPMGGDESPGHAPMGGGDQQHNTKAGSKVEDVGDEKDPSGDSGD